MVIDSPLGRNEAAECIRSAALDGYAHYVYGLVDALSGDLFYIGKGTKGRAFDHLRLDGRNYLKNLIIKENGCKYFLFGFYTTADLAFENEVLAIDSVGAKNLTNIARGGLGQDPKFASDFAKKQWSDPDSKIRKATSTPEFQANAAEACRRLWEDPEFRERHKAAMSAQSVRETLRERGVERMKCPEERYKAGNGKRGVKQDPEVVALRAKGARKYWSDEENRKAHSDRMSKVTSTFGARRDKYKAYMEHLVNKCAPKSGYFGVEEATLKDGSKVYRAVTTTSGKRRRLQNFSNPVNAYKEYYMHYKDLGYDVSMLPNPEDAN